MTVQTAVRSAALGLTSGLLLAGPLRAEDPQQPFTSLVARGFKVVATSVVSAVDSKQSDAAFVVTLQLDKAVAVCTFGIGNWENMNEQSLANPKNCDVRFY